MKKQIITMLIIIILLLSFANISLAADDAVCSSSTDCVLQGYCFAQGAAGADTTGAFTIICNGVTGDVDCDGDRDYCLNKVWVDCGSGCSTGNCCPNVYYCSGNDCVPSTQSWMSDGACTSAGGSWTSGITGQTWRNMDANPGDGDFETYGELPVGNEVIGAQCVTASGEAPFYTLTDNRIHCFDDAQYTSKCVNSENQPPYNSCPDLKARWCIRPSTCAAPAHAVVPSGEFNDNPVIYYDGDPLFGGYSFFGQIGCCENQGGEYYNPSKCSNTPSSVNACCSTNTDMIDPQGRCWRTDGLNIIFAYIVGCLGCDNRGGGTEGDGSLAACSSTGGQWNLNLGNSAAQCWNKPAGSDLGDGMSANIDYLCCGDDNNEFPRSCGLNAVAPALTCGAAYACCNGKEDCLNPNGNGCVEGFMPRTAAQVKASGEDKFALCTYKEWMDCDAKGSLPALGAFVFCGDAICGSNGGVPVGKNVAVGDYSQYPDKSMQCCGDDDGEKFVSVLQSGSAVSSLNVKNSGGSTITGVCCRATDPYVTYGGGGALDFTCGGCTTDADCGTGMHCDILHSDADGTAHCCSKSPPRTWDSATGKCVGSTECQNKCAANPFSTNCIGPAASTCDANEFCCPVPYQTPGDCFSFTDSIMGAIPY